MIEPKQKKVAELATLNLSGVDGTRTFTLSYADTGRSFRINH